MRGNGTVKFVVGSLVGAIVACILCWIACYILTKANVGFFAGKEHVTSGRNAISRSALNIYTIQHVTLTGSGTITDETGSKQNLSARIILPYSVWTLIPIVTLFVAFAIALKISDTETRKQAVIVTLLTSLFYALILAVCAGFIQAPMDSVPIPEISGTSVSPPAVDFIPSSISAFTYCLLLGCCAAFIRWVISKSRNSHTEQIGFWHPCAASVISMALIILFTLSIGIWFATRNKAPDSGIGFIELIPASAGAVYSGLFGASITARADSEMSLGGGKSTLFALKGNLYGETTQNDGKKTETKAIPAVIKYGIMALIALSGFFVGLFAVRKGSSDGFLTTTARVILFHFIILAIIIWTTRLELISTMKSGEFVSTTSIIAATTLSWAMLIPMFIFGFASLIGAQLARSSLHRSYNL